MPSHEWVKEIFMTRASFDKKLTFLTSFVCSSITFVNKLEIKHKYTNYLKESCG